MVKIHLPKIFTKIFTHDKLPFLELRHSNSNKHYKKHLHDTFSIGINIQGNSIYTNKERTYDFAKDKIAIVNPLTIHSCNPLNNKANEYYMLYLEESWCYEIQKSFNEQIDSFKSFPVDILEDKILYMEFLALCENLFSDITIMEKENILINFFMQLFGNHIENSFSIIQEDTFTNISKYLEQKYFENITLEELSQKFGLNSFYIIRLFKTKINMTPHAYLLNIRINKAKKLLKNALPIAQTALECGFSDQSHFHRNFLKITASTPKQYQDNFL